MPYLQLKENIMMVPEESISREFLETGADGVYCSTTVQGIHTRKYHGLFVYEDSVSGEFFTLLSNLEILIENGDKNYELGGYFYPGNGYPSQMFFNKSFSISPVSTIFSEIRELKIIRQFLVDSRSRRVHIKLHFGGNCRGPLKVKLRPYLTFRNTHHLCSSNMDSSNRYREIDKGIGVKLYQNYPELLMQVSRKSDYVHAPDWYYNAEYPVEKGRGYPFSEDLFVPGYFELKVKAGEDIVFSAGIDQLPASSLTRRFNKELQERVTPESYSESLERAASQFFIKKPDSTRIRAGFPWFGVWGRDTFISLPGLTISKGEPGDFEKVLDSMIENIKGGLFPNMGNFSFNSVDAPLWFCWALQKYYYYIKGVKSKRVKFYKKYFPHIENVLDSFREGTNYNIKMDENYLVTQGIEGKALTWMDAVVDGEPVTPRRGVAVEINSLWYNGIGFALELASTNGNEDFLKEWQPVFEVAGNSFIEIFWDSEKGYLADRVENGVVHQEMRPNQVVAVSMPFSPLETPMKKSVLNYVRNFLVTPKGLRTLAAGEEGYIGYYIGDQNQRDEAYHQGTVWPWLSGHYCDALFGCYGSDSLEEIKKIYMGFEEEMLKEGIGTVSEVYDGNVPNKPGGSISQAWSVSELLRIREILSSEGKKL